MGNCIIKESPMVWAGEDWGSPASTSQMKIEEEGLMASDKKIKGCSDSSRSLFSSSASCASSSITTASTETATATAAVVTEVKIKITKKQLEELLGKIDVVGGLSVQQLLSHLMIASERFEAQQRSWSPALRSIPEDLN